MPKGRQATWYNVRLFNEDGEIIQEGKISGLTNARNFAKGKIVAVNWLYSSDINTLEGELIEAYQVTTETVVVQKFTLTFSKDDQEEVSSEN